ncbi:N-acetyltransferase family protein [Sphingobium aquiterrae]|uniref:GNAT family N-acetyltransferase n=1 Tax=Sphingobium aquiterrae TaxID=2038656 RepID=UPI0030176BB0
MLAVRDAEADDLERIAAIYAHHVLHGTATFDTEPPDIAAWRDKRDTIRGKGWPFLVAVEGGQVVGYAYATQFRDRTAYAHSCEDSIYIDAARLGRGVGGTLLGALMDTARQSGFRQMIAVIGGAEPGSIALHAKCGFDQVGRLRDVGRKFGRLLDTVYMQRAL